MLEDGIYGLNYVAQGLDGPEQDDALAVLRDGKIMGSDQYGGLLTGAYDFDPVAEKSLVNVRMTVPPGGVLLTGQRVGVEGTTIDIAGAVGRLVPGGATVVDVAGSSVEVRLTYIGPLPN